MEPLFGEHNGIKYLKRTPTAAEFPSLTELQGTSEMVTAVVAVGFGDVACSSGDGTYDGLNDIVDDWLVPEDAAGSGLSDISYKAVGVLPATTVEPTGFVLIEVVADAGEVLADLDGSYADDEDGDYASIEECRESGQHMTSVDDSGYCNHCGEQDK